MKRYLMACELYLNKAFYFFWRYFQGPNQILRRKIYSSPFQLFKVLTFRKLIYLELFSYEAEREAKIFTTALYVIIKSQKQHQCPMLGKVY